MPRDHFWWSCDHMRHLLRAVLRAVLRSLILHSGVTSGESQGFYGMLRIEAESAGQPYARHAFCLRTITQPFIHNVSNSLPPATSKILASKRRSPYTLSSCSKMLSPTPGSSVMISAHVFSSLDYFI